ncbi:hypothetical protein RSAG8_12751, partial [Rhizoctonia solani AG-8 WAC10335]
MTCQSSTGWVTCKGIGNGMGRGVCMSACQVQRIFCYQDDTPSEHINSE